MRASFAPYNTCEDIDALVAYLVNFKAPNAAYNPTSVALRKPRIVKLP